MKLAYEMKWLPGGQSQPNYQSTCCKKVSISASLKWNAAIIDVIKYTCAWHVKMSILEVYPEDF